MSLPLPAAISSSGVQPNRSAGCYVFCWKNNSEFLKVHVLRKRPVRGAFCLRKTMNVPHVKPELLAPAGSLESFFAALEKGADAVYAGLQDFSARARAKNFTLAQMERMLAHAHGQNRKIYITLNTLVKEKELPQLVDTLAALAGMRVDGVILQDLAVARIIRNHFPSIPLHASTQMTIHNTPGVKMLEQLGFQRAVLARELAVDEIAAIAASSPVEIECFVHGALCFSISGQCFFSSLLGGHSGNRGRCAQPCRRLYNHRGKEGHYFSTSDLSAIDMIPDLVKAGVKSLKIEGRMKSAEYVASVVEAYRTVLDAPEKAHKEALTAAKGILKYSFGRTPTKGFLASQQPDDIANPWQKGGTGRFIGQIKSIKGKSLIFETRDALHVGDRLRAQPKSDMAGQAWTVRELVFNRKKCMEAPAGSIVEVETPFSFSVGDSIYKVSSKEAYTLSDNACLRRLEGGQGDKLPCRLTLKLIPVGEDITSSLATASPTPQPPPVKGGGAFGRDALFLQNLPRLTTRTEHIKQLRQAILNLAVRGRLVPQDPNDEPAAELLKQIQAEKVRLVKEGVQKKEVVLPALDLNRAPFALPFGWSWARFPELGKFGRGKSKHRPRCHHQ
jgi:collagenase-like PrtC family protease